MHMCVCVQASFTPSNNSIARSSTPWEQLRSPPGPLEFIATGTGEVGLVASLHFVPKVGQASGGWSGGRVGGVSIRESMPLGMCLSECSCVLLHLPGATPLTAPHLSQHIPPPEPPSRHACTACLMHLSVGPPAPPPQHPTFTPPLYVGPPVAHTLHPTFTTTLYVGH